MNTIIVYRARDGRYAYCPSQVRHWNAFSFEGQFQTEREAFSAALADPTIPKDATIRVEGA